MSSPETSRITPLQGNHRKTRITGTQTDPKTRERAPRLRRRLLASRRNAALLLRSTLRLFVLCSALYALYTFGLYLLFKDRLFYSLFVARSLVL